MSDSGDKTTLNEPDRENGEAGSTAPQRDRPWLFRDLRGPLHGGRLQ